MTIQFFPNGIGGSLGDQLDTCAPLSASGQVWYVSSLIGTDAASPAGQQRDKPLATLQQAVTSAAADDIIVMLTGHTETLSSTITLSKRLTLIGEGATSGKPGASLRSAGGSAPLFSVTSNNVELRNIYFPTASTTAVGKRIAIAVGADLCLIKGCYFECGANDLATTIEVSGNQCTIEGTTIISTATSRSAQPTRGLGAGAVTILNLWLKDTVISNGTVGFVGVAADLSTATTISMFKATNLSLLLGADLTLPSSATGYSNVQRATGGSRVIW